VISEWFRRSSALAKATARQTDRYKIDRPGVKTWWSLRRAMFAAGFCSYLEATEPISDLPSVTQLIRGKQ
jgi:hypothetical protein